MSKTWLVIDVNNLAWRAHHTTGGMRHDGKPMGVIYGILRELIGLHDRFLSHNFVFCFDSPTSFREQLFSGYKISRKVRGMGDSPEARTHRENRKEVECQMNELYYDLLSRLGIKNLFCHAGYEADDMIAQVCRNNGKDQYVIVSSDTDLYQLLEQDRVTVFSPQTRGFMTEEKFTRVHGIDPQDWAWVKAVAGCKTDDIPGVEGVGEFRACQYLQGQLKENKGSGEKIKNFLSTEQFRINMRLTQLPYDCKIECPLRTQPMIQEEDWEDVTQSLGIKTLPYINFAK